MSVEKTGYNVHVTFANVPDLVLHCKAVKPSGMDLGTPIDLTTNATVGALEKCAADLAESTDITLTAAVDLADRAKFAAQLGVYQDISIEFRTSTNRATGQKITHKGAWLNSWEPNEMTRGEQPTVALTIMTQGGTSSGTGADWDAEGTLSPLA